MYDVIIMCVLLRRMCVAALREDLSEFISGAERETELEHEASNILSAYRGDTAGMTHH